MASALELFNKSLLYENTTTVAGWWQDADLLRAVEQRGKRLRRQWYRANVLVGLALLGCIVMAVTHQDTLQPGFMGVLLGFPAVLLVIGLIRQSTVTEREVEGHRRELTVSLLTVLRREMADDAPLAIRLDLLPVEDASKPRERSTVDGWTVDTYVDPWLTLSGRFRDGVTFSLDLREHLVDRKGWERSQNGEPTLKHQREGVLEVTLKLTPSAETARTPQDVPALGSKLELPLEAQVVGLRMEAGTAVLEVLVREPWQVRPASAAGVVELLVRMFDGTKTLAPPVTL